MLRHVLFNSNTNKLFKLTKISFTKKQNLSIYNNKLLQRKFVLIFALLIQHNLI